MGGRVYAAALIAASLCVVAGCGGHGQASPPVVTQTVVVGPPSSEPALTPTQETSVGPGTDPGTVESRAAACRELRYFDLLPSSERNGTIADLVVVEWKKANENSEDPRWLGCVVDDPSSDLGVYVSSTHLLTDVVPPPADPIGDGTPERSIVAKLVDRQQRDGNWVNVEETATLHVVFHKLPPYQTGIWLLKGLSITDSSAIGLGELGPGGTYGVM